MKGKAPQIMADQIVSVIIDIRQKITPRYPPAGLLESFRQSISLQGNSGKVGDVRHLKSKFLLLLARRKYAELLFQAGQEERYLVGKDGKRFGPVQRKYLESISERLYQVSR